MPTTAEALKLIILLMPGLIGAGVMSYVRNASLSTASLAIFAVLIGMLVNPLAVYFGVHVLGLGDLSSDQTTSFAATGYFLFASCVAVLLGILFGKIIDSDWVRRTMFHAGLSREYALGSVWEHVLREKQGKWATFHFSKPDRDPLIRVMIGPEPTTPKPSFKPKPAEKPSKG